MTRQQEQKFSIGCITLVAAVAVIPIVLVIVFIVVQGVGAISWDFLTSAPMSLNGFWT